MDSLSALCLQVIHSPLFEFFSLLAREHAQSSHMLAILAAFISVTGPNAVIKRLAFDRLLFAPLFMLLFFIGVNILEVDLANKM